MVVRLIGMSTALADERYRQSWENSAWVRRWSGEVKVETVHSCERDAEATGTTRLP